MKIVALTSDGGMVINQVYEVGAEVASALIQSKRAKPFGIDEPIVKPKRKK